MDCGVRMAFQAVTCTRLEKYMVFKKSQEMADGLGNPGLLSSTSIIVSSYHYYDIHLRSLSSWKMLMDLGIIHMRCLICLLFAGKFKNRFFQ